VELELVLELLEELELEVVVPSPVFPPPDEVPEPVIPPLVPLLLETRPVGGVPVDEQPAPSKARRTKGAMRAGIGVPR
jgi:hypothetical protein